MPTPSAQNSVGATPPLTRPVRLAMPHRFSRDDYHAIAAAGILGEDDRVELIAGEIVSQMPIGTTHASMVNRLNQVLTRVVAEHAIVSVQNPIALDLFSEPQPDIALLRPKPGFYAESHPQPEDVLLIIEVADASLAFDREEKIPLYAAAGIVEVWLVDLIDKSITVYRQPQGVSYAAVDRLKAGAELVVPGVAGTLLAIRELGL
jgi:Uma2 family endonuclease